MRLLRIDIDKGKDDLPSMTIESGHLIVNVELLRFRLARWHFWKTDRAYHGVWGRVLMVPFGTLNVEYFGPMPSSE